MAADRQACSLKLAIIRTSTVMDLLDILIAILELIFENEDILNFIIEMVGIKLPINTKRTDNVLNSTS